MVFLDCDQEFLNNVVDTFVYKSQHCDILANYYIHNHMTDAREIDVLLYFFLTAVTLLSCLPVYAFWCVCVCVCVCVCLCVLLLLFLK